MPIYLIQNYCKAYLNIREVISHEPEMPENSVFEREEYDNVVKCSVDF
jgi:hypothetical protein